MLFSLIYQTRLTSLARKCLCVSEFLKPRAAKGERAVLVSGWLIGGWAPGFGVAGAGGIRKKALEISKAFGGSRGSRTPDPLLVRQML